MKGIGKMDYEKDADIKPEDYQKEITNILAGVGTTVSHEAKRVFSFEYLDQMLESCHTCSCPCVYDANAFHTVLIDISIETYVNQRAYYYSIDNIGDNDVDRINKARLKILNHLYCTKKPTKELYKLFLLDDQRLREPSTELSARRRKAYWSYLKKRPNNNPIDDFLSASGVIDFCLDSSRSLNGLTIDELRLFMLNHTHVISGLDLYRFCFLRAQIEEQEIE
jgi:hypothetical protein